MTYSKCARRQALAEYIVLVGLVAILLIGAVFWFGRRVDEAYEGSERAFRTSITQPMSGAPATPTLQRTTTAPSGQKYDIYDIGGRPVAVPSGSQPSSTSPDYDPIAHGV